MAVRDLISSPHVAQLLASASPKDGTSRAQVQAQVFIPTVAPAPSQPNTAAVVLNGCALAVNNSANPASTSRTTGTAANVCPGSHTPSTCAPSLGQRTGRDHPRTDPQPGLRRNRATA
jgi:hypothetical protein